MAASNAPLAHDELDVAVGIVMVQDEPMPRFRAGKVELNITPEALDALDAWIRKCVEQDIDELRNLPLIVSGLEQFGIDMGPYIES